MPWPTRTKSTATDVQDDPDLRSLDDLLTDIDDEDAADEALLNPAGATGTRARRPSPLKRARRGVSKVRNRRHKAPRDAAQWTAGGQLATKVATGAMILAGVCGPVALGWQVLKPQQAVKEARSNGVDQRLMNRRDAAGDVAVQFVPAWLTATRDAHARLESWWPNATALSLPEKPSTALNTSVLRATPAGPGMWLVVVGTDVTVAGQQNPSRRYFQVPVSVAGAGNVAATPTTLPAEIPPPSRTVKDVKLEYPRQVTPSSPVVTSISGFLNALLTGKGDITLYERPGVWIPPVTPAPWKTVTVDQVLASNATAPTALSGTRPRDGQTAQLLVTTTLAGDQGQTGQDGNTTTSMYLLTLTARDGRWEVTAVTGAPSVTEKQTRNATKPR